jgi:tol-pal system protein YbgF
MLLRFIFVLSILLSGQPAIALDPDDPVRPEPATLLAQAGDAPGVEGEPLDSETPPPSAPAGQDPAGLTTRIDRLERQLRQITGENEELQHKVQVLEEELRAARQPEPPKNAEAPRSTETTAKPIEATSPGRPLPQERARADAFRPSAAPNAPGAPKPLGAASPSAPLEAAPKGVGAAPAGGAPRDSGAPLDIAHGRLVGAQPPTGANDAPMGAALTPSTAPQGPQQEYDNAVATLKAGRYEAAEQALSTFLAKNPKSKLTPAALYNIGESFFLRGRRREAAEKYLEISNKYSQSSLAPDALLRLGQSLASLGAKEQACAAFNEIGVKYPSAIGRLRESVERENKKLQC